MLSRLALGAPVISARLIQNACKQLPRQQVRLYARNPRESFSRMAKTEKISLKDRLMGPPGANAYSIGKGVAAGGAVLGLGALGFYGLGLGSGVSVLNNSMLWPDYVKQRIHSTYLYFGGSVLFSALSAVAVFRTPALLNLVSRNGFMSILATFAVMIGSGMVARGIPYQEGFGTKQLAWLAHTAIVGAVVAPLCLVGGPILTRAALYTAGIVGGLSTCAVCAPSDKFLYMGGPLAIGLGFVFAASMASMFLPPVTALGAGLYSISLYGGLVLFGGFLLYDTQRIIRKAETYPVYTTQPFDPINSAMSIYMDTLNIFIRIVSILAGGGGSRRK